MYYEINVSLNGVHFFATAERSITTPYHLARVYEALAAYFTPEQGFTLMVRKWETVGTHVDVTKLPH